MKPKSTLPLLIVAGSLLGAISCTTSTQDRSAPQSDPISQNTGMSQVPSWSRADLDFFLHDSMGTEVVPEVVLHAFIRPYPDLFPSPDLANFGLIPDPGVGLPVGTSRRSVPHLGGLPALGVNCAVCHVGEVALAPGAARVRVLGMISHFDAEAFFGAVTVATFRTADPANMKRFLGHYLAVGDPNGGAEAQERLAKEWQRQKSQLAAAITADPFGSKDVAPGTLHMIGAADLRLDRNVLAFSPNLVPLARSLLKLFHNMRGSLHIPHQPPDKAPPASGPGRNDAFGLLSVVLFGVPQPYAPVKYGLAWNLDQRRWVHWDGNTQSPIGRNLLASLGLGAPLIGKRGQLDFVSVRRHTDLSERIRAPRYPFEIDAAAAKRGAAHYQARCASCHDGPENDRRLHAIEEIGTESGRARLFTQVQADRFNRFLAELEIPGYQPSNEPGIRGTQRYWAPSLAGVWARSPYLHNGSVRTVQELLTPPSGRSQSFRRGSGVYDAAQMGYTDEGASLFDTTSPDNSNAGHEYGTDLSGAHRRDLIEYLKTL